MSTPNLDAMGHQWVGALAQFNFELEYQKGHDNMGADILSKFTTQLDLETVKSMLNGGTFGMMHQAKVPNPAMMEGDQCLEKELQATHWWRCMLQLGQSPERGPNVEHNVGLAEGTEADKSKDASGGRHLQWRR